MYQLQVNGNFTVIGSKDMTEAEHKQALADLTAQLDNLKVTVNGQVVKHVKVKEFSTGSVGYNINGKVLLAGSDAKAA